MSEPPVPPELASRTLGAEGEPCPACGAPLAADQRYCLNCGRRRAGSRVPYADLLAGRAPEDVLAPASSPPPPPPPPEPRRTVPLTVAAVAGGCAALVLALGVLLGAATSGEEAPRQVAAQPVQQRPPVINVNAGTPTAAAEEEFASDWPGEDGFTIQLETLDKASSAVADVDSAKSEAEAAGAEEVGALDSDDWPSIDPGLYVIYSGVYTGKKAKADAQKALKKLKKDFPDAQVVEVSGGEVPGAQGTKPEEQVQEVDDSALEDLQNATGEEQQEKSAKLPPTLGTGGEPPPTDEGEAGGGTDSEVIE